MTDSYRERADLQRRQIFHQQLLDSQRFRAESSPGADKDFPGAESGGGGDFGEGLLALGGLILIVVLLFAAAVGALLAVSAALPAAIALQVLTRTIWKESCGGFGTAYLAALFGLLAYVSITVAMALLIGLIHSPANQPGVLAHIADALWTVAAHGSDALHAIGRAPVSIPWLLGFGVDGAQSIPVNAAALFIFHAPGWLGCAAALSYWIGVPYFGWRGWVAAFVTSVLVVPTSLALTASLGLLIFRSYAGT